MKEIERLSTGSTASARRDLAVDGAMAVLASLGARGFTHREVDRRLEWPIGSTPNYYRRREDLLAAVGSRLMERDLADLRAILNATLERAPWSTENAVDVFVQLFQQWMRPENRMRTLARLEILIERLRNEDLREATKTPLSHAFEVYEDIFRRLGSRAPAKSARSFGQMVVGLHLIVSDDRALPKPNVLRGLLANLLTMSLDP